MLRNSSLTIYQKSDTAPSPLWPAHPWFAILLQETAMNTTFPTFHAFIDKTTERSWVWKIWPLNLLFMSPFGANVTKLTHSASFNIPVDFIADDLNFCPVGYFYFFVMCHHQCVSDI